jgi:hypothetical protein
MRPVESILEKGGVENWLHMPWCDYGRLEGVSRGSVALLA